MASLPMKAPAVHRAQRLTFHRTTPVRAPSQRCAGLSEVGKYLQEAVEHIFQPEPSSMDWKATSFSGTISHDDHNRLRKIYKIVKSTPRDMSAAAVEASEKEAAEQKRYLQGALEKVFASKTEEEPEKWVMQPYEGTISSKREIERMLFVEKVVKKALDEAEKQQK